MLVWNSNVELKNYSTLYWYKSHGDKALKQIVVEAIVLIGHANERTLLL